MWIRDIGISLKLDTVQGSIMLIIKYKDFGAPTVQWRRQRPTSCSRVFEYQLLCPYFSYIAWYYWYRERQKEGRVGPYLKVILNFTFDDNYLRRH